MSVGTLAAALAKAQAEMQNPAFDKQNPHFKSKFASLAAVRNAVVPVLAKHGIACVQSLETADRGVGVVTHLLHESGETLTYGPLVMPASKPDAQGIGSAATYARRYALMAVAGVVGDEDDDGNVASERPATRPVAPSNGKATAQTRFGNAIRKWSGISNGQDLMDAAAAVAESLGVVFKGLAPDAPEWTTAAEFCEKKIADGVDFLEWSKA